jgi:hypothetical protein
MRTPYWSDAAATLYVGDAREVLAEMPGSAVDCIVTSPPFWGLVNCTKILIVFRFVLRAASNGVLVQVRDVRMLLVHGSWIWRGSGRWLLVRGHGRRMSFSIVEASSWTRSARICAI